MSVRNKKIFFILLILLISILINSCSLPSLTSLRIRQEKKLTMYVAYGHPERIAEAFEEATGIKIEFLTMSSGEVLTRLRAEKTNPQTDVWLGGGSDAFITAKKEGLLAAYLSPNASQVNPAFRDPEGYWTGVSLVLVGFIVNEERLQSRGLPQPYKWTDLANPIYANEIIASNPTTSGTAYTTVSGILQLYKGEKGWAFLDQLYRNVPYLEKSGAAPAKLVLTGEFSVGIAPDPHIAVLRNPHAPVKAIYPQDGTLAWPSPVAIIAGAKHPDNAQRFVDWVLSPEGQRVLMQASPRLPTTDVPVISGVPKPEELHLIPYDFAKWGASRNQVIEQFRQRYSRFF